MSTSTVPPRSPTSPVAPPQCSAATAAVTEAYLDVVFGAAQPGGSLPFDLPQSMAAVEASRSDVPFDTADPLFTFGHGLRYGDGY